MIRSGPLLAHVGATGPLSHPWPSMDFTSPQIALAHSDSVPSMAHPNSTSQACSPSQHNWGMGPPRHVYMGGCFYRMSRCFAFVIVMLLCVCYFTSSSFVFSLLLLCTALPVSKRDLISLPRHAACKNNQLLHICEIEHDELRLSLVYTPQICDPVLSSHTGWPTAMQMRVKPAKAVHKERVDF